MSEKSWQLNRPVYLRLPDESSAYQGNEIVNAITTPWDEQLVDIKNTLLNFNNDFINPDTARVDALDWLAQLSGFTGEYWDTNWTVAIKRELIKNSHTKIWTHKGTVILLQYLLDLFGLDAVVYVENVWFIGITAIGSPVGGRTLYYAIKLFIPGAENRQFYMRNSKEWKFIERLNRLYMPCWCGSIPTNGNFIHYEKFIIGVSAVGDPIWSGSINKKPTITVNFGSGITINSSMQIGANFGIGFGFDARIIRPIIVNFGIGNSANTTKVITSNFGIGFGFDARIIRPIIVNFGVGNSANTTKVIASNFGIGSGFDAAKVITSNFGIGSGFNSSKVIVADFGIGNADNTTRVIVADFNIGGGFDAAKVTVADFGIGSSVNSSKVIVADFGIGNADNITRVIVADFGIGGGFSSSITIVADFGVGNGVNSSTTIVADFGIGNDANIAKIIVANFGVGNCFDLSTTIVADFGIGNSANIAKAIVADFGVGSGFSSLSALTLTTDSLLIHLNPASYPGTGTVWNDVQGNFNFDLVGGVSYSVLNEEMVFNGSTGYAQTVNNPNIPQGVIPFSLEMYISLNNFTYPFLTSKTSPSNVNLSLAIDQIQLGFTSDGGGGNVNYSTGVLTPGNSTNVYYHLLATYDGNVIRLYRNGALVHTSATGRNLGGNSAPLRLMCFDPSNGSYFWPVSGKLKVFRLYTKKLSNEEVLQNYNHTIDLYS